MSNPVNGSLGQRLVVVAGGGSAFTILPATVIASVNTADPAALVDGNVAMLSVDATGQLRVRPPTAGTATFPAQASDCLAARATTAAPGVGAALVTIATPPAGYYLITATVFFVVAGTVNNAEFREGAAVVSTLQLPAVISQIPLVHTFYRSLDGATNISINATAADAVGSYSAMLIATRQA